MHQNVSASWTTTAANEVSTQQQGRGPELTTMANCSSVILPGSFSSNAKPTQPTNCSSSPSNRTKQANVTREGREKHHVERRGQIVDALDISARDNKNGISITISSREEQQRRAADKRRQRRSVTCDVPAGRVPNGPRVQNALQALQRRAKSTPAVSTDERQRRAGARRTTHPLDILVLEQRHAGIGARNIHLDLHAQESENQR